MLLRHDARAPPPPKESHRTRKGSGFWDTTFFQNLFRDFEFCVWFFGGRGLGFRGKKRRRCPKNLTSDDSHHFSWFKNVLPTAFLRFPWPPPVQFSKWKRFGFFQNLMAGEGSGPLAKSQRVAGFTFSGGSPPGAFTCHL